MTDAPTKKRPRRKKMPGYMSDKTPMGPLVTRDQVFHAVQGLPELGGGKDAEAFAEAACDALRLETGPSKELGLADVFDLRGEQDYKYPGGVHKVKMRGHAPERRNPASVTTIVVHQTGVEYGVSPWAVKRWKNRSVALARRALDVACHAMAFRDGFFVVAHDLDVYVNHAGRLNATSLGLEIDGRYPGLMDRPGTAAREDLQTTWKGAPSELTTRTVESACRALAWLVGTGRMMGMPIQYVTGHRISSDTRRADPGEEIWRRVVLNFAVAEIGLVPVRESPWTQGRPIPIQWDPKGIGDY